MSELEKIVVLKLNDKRSAFTTVPEEISDEVEKKIGSEFRRGTRDCIRGLDKEQEYQILPVILGVGANDARYETLARDYWADFSVVPTVEGLRLNIATIPKEVQIGDKTKTVEMPVNEVDYMTYRFAMGSRLVAKTPEELENVNNYNFYLIDLHQEEERKRNEFKLKKEALLEYAKLSANVEENIDTIDQLLQMLTAPGVYFNTRIPVADKDIRLSEFAQEKPSDFIKAVKDPNLATKALILKATSLSILKKEGNDYFFDEKNLGPGRAAISFLESPENSAVLVQIKSRIEGVEQNKIR